MILTEVNEIINDILKQNDQKLSIKITKETTFQEIGLSSFDLATLTVLIEDKFDIDIFENGIVSNFGQVVELIERRVNE